MTLIEFLREYGLLILGFLIGVNFKLSWLLLVKHEAVEINLKVNGEEIR